MKRKIVAIIFSLLSLICFTPTIKADFDVPDSMISSSKRGLAMVVSRYYNNEGTKLQGYGTAFAIGKKGEPVSYFITNFHCIADDNWKETEEIYIVKGDITDEENNYVKAEIVYGNSDYDYAILKSQKPISSVIPVTLSDRVASEGESIFVVGFPGEAQYDIVVVSEEYASFSKGDITNNAYDVPITSRITGKTHITKDEYISTARITGGYSGSPMFDQNGLVIGVSSATEYDINKDGTKDYKNSYAVKMINIIKALNDLPIEYEKYSYSNDDTIETDISMSSNDPTPYGNSNSSADINVSSYDNTTQNNDAFRILLSFTLIVIIIAVICFILYYFKNNRKKDEQLQKEKSYIITNDNNVVPKTKETVEPKTKIFNKQYRIIFNDTYYSEIMIEDMNYYVGSGDSDIKPQNDSSAVLINKQCGLKHSNGVLEITCAKSAQIFIVRFNDDGKQNIITLGESSNLYQYALPIESNYIIFLTDDSCWIRIK